MVGNGFETLDQVNPTAIVVMDALESSCLEKFIYRLRWVTSIFDWCQVKLERVSMLLYLLPLILNTEMPANRLKIMLVQKTPTYPR